MASLPIRLTALIVFVVLSVQGASAGIMNGDFSTDLSDPTNGWETDFFIGNAPVSDAGRAKFEVADNPFNPVQLQQVFLLPSDAASLSFEFLLSAQVTTSPPIPPFDFFQASLLDPVTFNPLISLDPFAFPYFSIDADGNVLRANEVSDPELLSNGFTRVSVDVTALQNQEVLLEFFAFGDFDGLTTTILVDNATISGNAAVVPEPGAIFIWLFLTLAMLGLTVYRRVQPRIYALLGKQFN